MGLDIASGLHELLDTVPGLEEVAKKNNAALYEARIPKGPFPIATAQPRSGKMRARPITNGGVMIGNKETVRINPLA